MSITTDDFLIDLVGMESSGDDGGEVKRRVEVKYAVVVGLSANETAKLQFAGETEPSEKEYAYLAWYAPKVNDRVVLIKAKGVYIIIGKLKYNERPDKMDLSEYMTAEQVNTILAAYAKTTDLAPYAKTTDLNNYVKKSSSTVANVELSATLTAVIGRINVLLITLRSTGVIKS